MGRGGERGHEEDGPMDTGEYSAGRAKEFTQAAFVCLCLDWRHLPETFADGNLSLAHRFYYCDSIFLIFGTKDIHVQV